MSAIAVLGRRSRLTLESDFSILRSHAAVTFPRYRMRAKGGGGRIYAGTNVPAAATLVVRSSRVSSTGCACGKHVSAANSQCIVRRRQGG